MLRPYFILPVALTAAFGQAPPAPVPAPLAHYHHTHFNSVDPSAAIDFYTTKFNGEKAKFGTTDAVWTGKSWLLFNKVAQPPPSDIIAAIYHIGWGATDIKAAYQHQLDIGTRFETPLGDLADLLGTGTPGRGYYAYVNGPDHALIEMNGGAANNFSHVHFLSDDPVGASEWFSKEFGVARRGPAPSREPRKNKDGQQIAPAVFMSMDGVLFAWFPTEFAKAVYPRQWQGHTTPVSNKGRVIDHVAFGVDDLDATLARMRADGVTITDPPSLIPGTKMRSAFIEGPDRLRIELIQDQASK